jgi:hypothetical protein
MDVGWVLCKFSQVHAGLITYPDTGIRLWTMSMVNKREERVSRAAWENFSSTLSDQDMRVLILILASHGIDSLNCTLASLCETAAVGLGHSRKGVVTALIPCLPMFFSTWETYHTHTLYLGYFNGPTGRFA